MKTSPSFQPNYVLIDFENVHPKNLSLLQGEHFKIYMFVGAQQTKLDISIVEAMQKLGSKRAKYVRVEESGKNALDFCLTFYLGAMVAKKPKGRFHIISKDKGFDPLVAHLQARGIKANRWDCLSHIPSVRALENSKMEEKIEAVLTNLKARGDTKPRKKEAMINTLKNIFKDDLSEQDASKLFQKLIETKHVTLKGDRLTYKLSA